MAALNSISEFNEAFDLPELCILYLQKKKSNSNLLGRGRRKEEKEKGNEKED